MKILYISSRYEGGLGGNAKNIAKKLNENGYDVRLMHVPHIPIKRLKNPSFTVFGILKALVNREKYDVVHAWNIPSAFVMKYVNANKKILSVYGAYSEQIGLLHSKAAGSLASKAELKAFEISDYLTTDSKAVQKHYKETVNADFIHLAPPLDYERFENVRQVEREKNQIAYIGRDSVEKGIDILRNIESKINGKVVYCTNLPWEKAMEILKSSSLLVVPSRMESLPNIIREAFYLKVPVIATDVGGISEIVTNNETGILIPPENPTKMLDVINSLLADTNLQDRLKENAFKFLLENFSWDVFLPKCFELYEK